MAPSLSVIIPTYNRAAWLPACVGSLRNSGVDDLEIIVVDDGSTDDTAEVIAGLGRDIVLLRQPNQGPAAARNRGFCRSRGRCVGFLDSDDQWLPQAPRQAVDWLDRFPEVDLLFSDVRRGSAAEGFRSGIEMSGVESFFRLPCLEPASGFRIFERVPLFRRIAQRNPIQIAAVIVRREAFERAGMFDPDLRGAADWELWLRMASRMTFAFWPGPLAVYTRHAEAMSLDDDHMGGEFCLALDKVIKKCPWLAGPERRLLESLLAPLRFGHAYRAYDRGEYAEARKRFALVLRRSGWDLRGFLYWCLCVLPHGLTGRLRRWKQALYP